MRPLDVFLLMAAIGGGVAVCALMGIGLVALIDLVADRMVNGWKKDR